MFGSSAYLKHAIPKKEATDIYHICDSWNGCLLSAYVTTFLPDIFHAGTAAAVMEITPVCEEVMKFLPLLFYLLVFEPRINGR